MEKKKQIITAVCISAVLIVVLVLCFVFGRKKEGGTSEGDTWWTPPGRSEIGRASCRERV